MSTAQSKASVALALQRASWDADRSVDLVDFTVGELLTERANAHPDRVAIVGVRHGTREQVRMTYRQLHHEAGRVATALARVAERGSYIAIWAPNVVEWPIIQYGAALAGMVLVAVNPALRDEELHYVLQHSGAVVLLHADTNRDYDMGVVARRVAARLPELMCVSLSDAAAWRAEHIDDGVLRNASSDADDVVMLQYTSGTTGRPKGVLLKHKSLINVARLTLEAVSVPTGAVCLNPLPMFHTAGCVIATLGPLWAGGTVVLVDRFSPVPVLVALREERVSVLFYVPAVLASLLEVQRTSDAAAPQLHTVMGGASNVSPALIEAAERVFGATVVNLFGQTELSPVLTATRPDDSRADQLNTVGHPLPQVDCRIVDPVNGEVVKVGETGEICARGYQAFVGYLHDPDATARTIDADGFVHTGDLGAMDSRGYLTLTGRLKELIIRGGENISPVEIETQLLNHEDVVDCAVVGLPDQRLGEVVAAVVRTPREDTRLKDLLIAHVRDRLAPFKVSDPMVHGGQIPSHTDRQGAQVRAARRDHQWRTPGTVTTPADIHTRRDELRRRFPEWWPRTLSDWLDHCAQLYGERPMVLTDDGALSYADVATESRRLADGLATLGVQHGDRVAMVMANYPELVAIKFAIARAGAIAVPLNYLYRSDELRFVLADSGCRVVVMMTGFADLDYQAMLDGIPDRLTVVLLDTDGRARPGVLTLEGLALLGDQNRGASDGRTSDPFGPGDMLYTSGTTGSPKGVLLSHDAVLRTAFASALTRAYQDGRRILFSLPCYHMFGYVEGLLSVTFVGGAVIPQTSFSAEGYFAGIERQQATDILCVPTMAVAMIEHPARRDYDLSSLSAILCGSAPAPVWLWERIHVDFGVSEIVTGYGMTESGGAMTLTRPEDPMELTSNTVGRPKMAGAAGLSGTDMLVEYRALDPESGAALPPGNEGELVSRGPTTMLQYWNRPHETAAVLRNGWLHSGDLGRVREDGYLQVTGRSKELYKSGGELVMPKEIEDLLAAHDEISQVFAIGLPDERWGEIGCVVVVPARRAVLTEDDVLALCRAKLARFKVPKRVVFYRAEDLPTTPTGKVQKYRLVQQLSNP
jgi:fatty-acyl-CoA synthase